MNTSSQDSPHFINTLLRLMLVPLERKKLFLILFFTPCILAAIVIWGFLPLKYKALMLFTTPPSSNFNSYSGISSIGQLDKLSSFSNFDLGDVFSDNTNVNLLITISKSWEVYNQLAEEFDLASHYEFKGRFRDDLYKQIRRNVKLELNDDEILELTVQDEDYRLARRMCDFLYGVIDSTYQAIYLQYASKNRLFFEKQLDSLSVRLDSAEARLISFQKDTQFYDLSAQLTATIEYLGGLQAEQQNVSIALLEETTYRGNTAKAEQLRLRLSGIEAQLKQSRSNKTGLPLLDVKNIPEHAARYAYLERDLKRYLALYMQMIQKYESAKFEEINSVDKLMIVSHARDNDKRVSPPRTIIMLVLMSFFALVALFVCLLVERYEKEKAQQSEFFHLISRMKKALGFRV